MKKVELPMKDEDLYDLAHNLNKEVNLRLNEVVPRHVELSDKEEKLRWHYIKVAQATYEMCQLWPFPKAYWEEDE